MGVGLQVCAPSSKGVTVAAVHLSQCKKPLLRPQPAALFQLAL